MGFASRWLLSFEQAVRFCQNCRYRRGLLRARSKAAGGGVGQSKGATETVPEERGVGQDASSYTLLACGRRCSSPSLHGFLTYTFVWQEWP